MVRVRGEEEWIEPCLLSVREFADEILLLDNGASAQTREVMERLRDPLGDRLRLERCPDLDLFQLSNLGLAKARYRWVIRWDADFVAHTSGPGDIRQLRRYLLGLDPRRYYLVYLPAAEVAGDLFHQFPDLQIRVDGQVHTASDRARYVPVQQVLPRSDVVAHYSLLREGSEFRVTLESLQVPIFYRVLRWGQIAYFHVNVKSARRTLMRHFWLEWLGRGEFGAFPTLESYVTAQLHERGCGDSNKAAREFMTLYCQGLVPFDPAPCGPYPDLLHPFLARPRYRVQYRDNQIIGRFEDS